MKIIVKNVNSDPRWTGNWIKYWDDNSHKSRPSICPCCGSSISLNGGAVGGHVKKANGDNDIYITPICDKCNKTFKNGKQDHEFEVDDSMLVHANECKLEEQSEDLDEKDVEILEAMGISEDIIKEVLK